MIFTWTLLMGMSVSNDNGPVKVAFKPILISTLIEFILPVSWVLLLTFSGPGKYDTLAQSGPTINITTMKQVINHLIRYLNCGVMWHDSSL